MNDDLKTRLQFLADKYETISFCDEDPSQFLRWYSCDDKNLRCDVEAASFLAAMLAFGSRRQFIPKIAGILKTADASSGSFSKWILSRRFEQDFPCGQEKFYRFYSFDDMRLFFADLGRIIGSAPSLGDFFRGQWQEQKARASKTDEPHLADVISASFPNAKIVPKGKTSANKRVHMFLRWMVRQNSPVDLGFWDWYSPANLIIPLDVHVMQEAANLALIPADASASRRTAERLTEAMAEVFPGDPARGDFALFGLGVDSLAHGG